MESTEDLRLVYGGRGSEREVMAFPHSPTWIVNGVYDRVREVVDTSLAAYLSYCQSRGLQHSSFLGLDVLITGELDGKGGVRDIRPTLLEGPCCNSNPACPNIDAYRLYKRAIQAGQDPDRVEYPIHPLKILDAMAGIFRAAWQAKTGDRNPTVAVLTRSFAESEEETAHNIVLRALQASGMSAHRITPEDSVRVANGKLMLRDAAIDVCYRRIETADMPRFYGDDLAQLIVNETPETLFINPWEIDVLRSKAVEEECFRSFEVAGGAAVSRPRTLIGTEITPDAMEAMMQRGGYAIKRVDSKGGRGVFLHLNDGFVRPVFRRLYGRYDGSRMDLHSELLPTAHVKAIAEAGGEAVVQQLRVLDARPQPDGTSLAYDMRINVMFDAMDRQWRIVSGMSRSIPMGVADSGNSLLTNVNAGAGIAPLIMGYTDQETEAMYSSPLLKALATGVTEWTPR